jgi:hypothetical protein
MSNQEFFPEVNVSLLRVFVFRRASEIPLIERVLLCRTDTRVAGSASLALIVIIEDATQAADLPSTLEQIGEDGHGLVPDDAALYPCGRIGIIAFLETATTWKDNELIIPKTATVLYGDSLQPSERAVTAPVAPQYGLHKEGETWTLVWEGRRNPGLKSRGFGLIQELLRRPGERLDMLVLARTDRVPLDEDKAALAKADLLGVDEEGNPMGALGFNACSEKSSYQPYADRTYRDATLCKLQDELHQIKSERAEAEAMNDHATIEACDRKTARIEKMIHDVRHGRFNDAATKARDAASHAIRHAVKKVGKVEPMAAVYLRESLKYISSTAPMFSPVKFLPWDLR